MVYQRNCSDGEVKFCQKLLLLVLLVLLISAVSLFINEIQTTVGITFRWLAKPLRCALAIMRPQAFTSTGSNMDPGTSRGFRFQSQENCSRGILFLFLRGNFIFNMCGWSVHLHFH
jgi:hypothetical protein